DLSPGELVGQDRVAIAVDRGAAGQRCGPEANDCERSETPLETSHRFPLRVELLEREAVLPGVSLGRYLAPDYRDERRAAPLGLTCQQPWTCDLISWPRYWAPAAVGCTPAVVHLVRSARTIAPQSMVTSLPRRPCGVTTSPFMLL